MRKTLLIFMISGFCIAQNLFAQDGVTIKVSEATLNDLIELASLSQLLSYSVWDRGSFTELLRNCDDRIEFRDQEFYHGSLANTVSIDIQTGNRFTLTSTQKSAEGNDVFLIGTGNIESPIALPPIFGGTPHLLVIQIEAIGTMSGYFSFENHKLKLVLDDVDLNFPGITEGGTTCQSSWAFPVGFIESWEMDINIGSALLPDALKGYFTSGSPSITTSSNELTVSYETIPFLETELDSTYSATAAHKVSLNNKIIPSSAQNSNITAGNVIILKEGFTVENGATFRASIEPYNFGNEVID